MTTIINGADDLHARVGQHLGYSDWLEITQDRVNQFADATGDHQWIHVDVARAEDRTLRRARSPTASSPSPSRPAC